MITVYSKNSCPHCVAAKNFLASHGIEFEEINVSEDDAALAFIKDRGHRSVPQLYVGDNILVLGGNAALQAMSADDIRERIAQLAG